jgi:hypothetical protein
MECQKPNMLSILCKMLDQNLLTIC